MVTRDYKPFVEKVKATEMEIFFFVDGILVYPKVVVESVLHVVCLLCSFVISLIFGSV